MFDFYPSSQGSPLDILTHAGRTIPKKSET